MKRFMEMFDRGEFKDMTTTEMRKTFEKKFGYKLDTFEVDAFVLKRGAEKRREKLAKGEYHRDECGFPVFHW